MIYEPHGMYYCIFVLNKLVSVSYYCVHTCKTLAMMGWTHWGQMMHICVGKLTIIGSDNGLSPGRWQAIIWTGAGILLIGPLGINFNEILIRIQTFSIKKMLLKMLSSKWHPFCLGLSVLNIFILNTKTMYVSKFKDGRPNSCWVAEA